MEVVLWVEGGLGFIGGLRKFQKMGRAFLGGVVPIPGIWEGEMGSS